MRRFKFTPPPSMAPKESALLKYSAVVLMVLGGANIAMSIGGFFDIPTAAWYATEVLGKNDPTVMLTVSGALAVAVGLAELVTGIIGYIRRGARGKMRLCMILAVVVAMLIIAAAVYRMAADSAENGLYSLIELVPVALYLIGAVRWKNGK